MSFLDPTKLGGLMKDKRGLVMGVANDRSIAWGIAKALHAAGAEMAFSYQGEALLKRVQPLAATVGVDTLLECDVTNTDSVAALFEALAKKWGKIDFLVHAIAFSDKNELDGRYLDTTRQNFLNTMDISVFSFTSAAKHAAAIMNAGGSMVTLTYYGAEQVIPHYNVMGVAKAALECSVKYLAEDLGKDNIRVNAVSAGPIKTLAASGIGELRLMLKWNELNAPLRRNVTQEEVGGTTLYLLSDLASAVTGENIHVDGGYHVTGMLAIDSAGETAELLAQVKGAKVAA
jgi:enoyl-[acyl-carrier protein] reductase I